MPLQAAAIEAQMDTTKGPEMTSQPLMQCLNLTLRGRVQWALL